MDILEEFESYQKQGWRLASVTFNDGYWSCLVTHDKYQPSDNDVYGPDSPYCVSSDGHHHIRTAMKGVLIQLRRNKWKK